MSLLSKLFRGNDQPPAEESPDDGSAAATDVAEPPTEVVGEQQRNADAEGAAEAVPPTADQARGHAPTDNQAPDELPWWEEVVTEQAPQVAASVADDGETAQLEPHAADQELEAGQAAAPDDGSAPSRALGEDEGTQPLTETDVPMLAALRSQRGLAMAAQRDIGRVRSINQDSVFALVTTLPRESSDVTIGLFVVADGMGGHDGGEVASRMAVTTVARSVLAELVLPALADNVTEALQPLIIAAVQDANHAIWEHAQMVGSDMGTTCTVALLLGHALYIAHVGDSRAYLATPTGMRMLTTDHSAVGRLIQVGQLDPSEARDHPMRSQLYRTVGQHPEVQVDFIYQPLGDASHLLLCSDGLWGMVDDEVLLDVLEHTIWPQDACRELIARANLAGGDDNISAVVVTLPTQN